MWRLPRTNDSNRCIPCRGKPDQHATHFPHSVHVWPSTIHISRDLRIATFHESSTVLDGYYCSREKKCSQLHLSARLSGPRDPPQFLSQHSYEAVGLSQASVDGRLLSLLGTYHYHAISTFNTCSWGPTHRSWTNTCGGYNIGGADLPH
jgi:hypothetical protein